MTNSKKDSELEEILKYLVDNVELIRLRVEMRMLKPADAFSHKERLKTQALQAINSKYIRRDLVEEAIGEDESVGNPKWCTYRNEIRAELRARLLNKETDK